MKKTVFKIVAFLIIIVVWWKLMVVAVWQETNAFPYSTAALGDLLAKLK